jgi:NitT/TauT family transport system substrate-binding protein
MKKNHGFNRKLLGLLAALAIIAPTLGGDVNATTTPDDTEESEETQALQMAYIFNPAVTPVELAVQQGFFADQGLDVEIIPFDNGAEIGAALAGGSLDVGLVGGALPVFTSQGIGTAFHVTLIERDTVRIYGDSTIETIADLEGKDVMTTVGTTAHVVLFNALKEAGLSLDDVNIVNSDQAGVVNAFVTGQVPAVAVFPPNTLAIEEARDDINTLATAGEFFPETMVFVAFVANDDFLESDRDALVAFSKAMQQANSYLIDNPEQARTEVYETVFASDMDRATYDAILDGFSPQTNEEWAEQFENGETLDALTRLENAFIDIGGLDEFVDPEEWFDPSIYLDAFEESNDS